MAGTFAPLVPAISHGPMHDGGLDEIRPSQSIVNNYLPSLRQLRYLVALREHGHFGRAAAANFVTQSTLSAGIADLERQLGVVLVERTRRTVRFTSIGEELVERSRKLVRSAEDLTDVARAAAEPLSGDIRLAVIPTIAPFWLARILPQIRTDWPRLDLVLREMTSPTACEALNHGQLDCVLLALPYRCGEIDFVEICRDPLLLGVPAAEGAGIDRPVLSVDIDFDRLLLLEDGHCLTDHALTACERTDAQSPAKTLCTSLHTLVQMVDHGMGITMLPKMAVDAGVLAGTSVMARPLASALATRQIALAWRHDSARAHEYRLLAASIATAIA